MKKKSLLSLALIILPFFLLLASCGGGSSSALPPSDTVGPNATPVSGGVVTTGKTPLVVNFNEAIFSASKGVPDGTNMVLTEKISTNSIPGAVQINTENNQLTFFPAENLIVNVEYELTLSDIFDGANNRLQATNGADYVWSFRVRDYPILKINSGTNSVVQQPQYSSNATNEVMAAWLEKLDTDYFLYTSIYSNNIWSAPELIDTASLAMNLNDVSSNGLGFAIAWTNNSNIFASVYSNGVWTNSSQLNSKASNSAVLASTYHPITSDTVNIVGEGYAIAWLEAGSPYASIFSQKKWNISNAVGAGSTTGNLHIASNGRGYALVWTGNDPSNSCTRGEQIFADVYSSTKGYWINTQNKNPTIISAGVETLTVDTTQDAFQPNIVSNGDSYMFYWYGGDQSNNGSYIHASIFTQLQTETATNTEVLQFDGPYKISNNGNVTNPKAVSDGSGYAITWSANSVSNVPNPNEFYVFINQYSYQSVNSRVGQWGLPLVMNNPAATTTADSVAIASNKNSYAVIWNQSEIDGGFSLYGRVLKNKVWSDSNILSKRNIGKVRGKFSISSLGDFYSVMWLQARNINSGDYDVYLNQFDGAIWQITPTQVSSNPIPGDQENTTIFNESNTLLALWTQNNPGQTRGFTQQLFSKQLLHLQPASNPITPILPAPQAIPGTIVGQNTNYVYATNIANTIANNNIPSSLAAFRIASKTNSLVKTLKPIDAMPLSPATIENYPISANSVLTTDNLGQTVFVTNKVGKLIAYAIDKNSGELTQTSSIAVGTDNNYAIATHPNGFIYVLYRPTISGNFGSVSAFRYGLQGKTLTSISLNSRVTNSVVSVQAAPIDMVIHPLGRYLYVINQRTNKLNDYGSISIFSINLSTGELTKNSDYDLAQAGLSVIPGNAAVSPDGKFLYLGDEFASIIRFSINSGGNLTVNPATDKFTEGVITNPRNLIIAPSGKYLYHLGVNKIYSYIIEPTNGALTPIFNTSNGFGYGDTTNVTRANALNQVRGLAISPDGKQLYVADKINSDPTNAGLYIFNVQQTTDIVFEILAGGLYNPGELVPDNTMPSGLTIISSKLGRCEVVLP